MLACFIFVSLESISTSGIYFKKVKREQEDSNPAIYNTQCAVLTQHPIGEQNLLQVTGS